MGSCALSPPPPKISMPSQLWMCKQCTFISVPFQIYTQGFIPIHMSSLRCSCCKILDYQVQIMPNIDYIQTTYNLLWMKLRIFGKPGIFQQEKVGGNWWASISHEKNLQLVLYPSICPPIEHIINIIGTMTRTVPFHYSIITSQDHMALL